MSFVNCIGVILLSLGHCGQKSVGFFLILFNMSYPLFGLPKLHSKVKSEISEVMIFLIYLLSGLSENRISSPSTQVVIETHSPLSSNSVIKFNPENYDQIIILCLSRQVMTHTTGKKWVPSLTASLSPTILPSLGQCHMAFHWPWVQ